MKPFFAPFLKHFIQPSPPPIAKLKSLHGLSRGQISLQPICSSKSHKCDKYDKTTYKISPYCQFPQPDHQAIHCPVTNFGPLVRGSVTNLILITAFDAYLTPRSLGAMSLVHKYINLKESYKQDIKEKVTIKKC